MQATSWWASSLRSMGRRRSAAASLHSSASEGSASAPLPTDHTRQLDASCGSGCGGHDHVSNRYSSLVTWYMSMMPSSVDPAQLATLNVLLQEGNVTRAAQRLGITQSSMSHRLAQLRQAVSDPLFVRAGAALVPTPRAAAMAQPLADALRALDACVAPEQRFDPSKARFTLQVAMPDLLATLGPRLSAAFLDDAPGIKVRVTNIGPALSTELAADVRRALDPADECADSAGKRGGRRARAAVARSARAAAQHPVRAGLACAVPTRQRSAGVCARLEGTVRFVPRLIR